MIHAENILLCIMLPLGVSILYIKGEVRRYVIGFLLGMAECLIAAYISGFLNLHTGMGANDTAIFLSPVVEELLKFQPLLFFLLLFMPEDHSFSMFAVAIGAGFATFENCCYILRSGADHLPYIMIRGLAVGVMHIVGIYALSLWMIVGKRLRLFSFPVVVGGIAVSMTFHALYNLLVSEPGVSSWIGYLMPVLTAIGLYLLYRKVSKVFATL
ncbi:MAG: PrsW family intramembrane metalloprotease [Lachnospiraceae bacterium]|nr:PrsW family intramembrane metalloprotease [Lachnospiraceae bacterium]